MWTPSAPEPKATSSETSSSSTTSRTFKGRHTITAGGDVRWLPLIAQRNDKVVGSLASLVATEDADLNGTHLKIPAANRPPSCSAAVTTFCLQPTDVLKWDRLYAATLGLVDNVNVLAVRTGVWMPQPFRYSADCQHQPAGVRLLCSGYLAYKADSNDHLRPRLRLANSANGGPWPANL